MFVFVLACLHVSGSKSGNCVAKVIYEVLCLTFPGRHVIDQDCSEGEGVVREYL